MIQRVLHLTLVVRDYDEALDFFVGKLGFVLLEDRDMPEQQKRWVLIAPPGGAPGTALVLGRASTPAQEQAIGRQAGDRVAFFLGTDDFWRDYTAMQAQGVRFVREPVRAAYGTVAVFADLYGNLWDLLGPPD